MSDVACPTGCGRKRPQGKVMCAPCWRRVPEPVQQRVYATWRAWRRAMGDGECFRAYAEAHAAAIAEAS